MERSASPLDTHWEQWVWRKVVAVDGFERVKSNIRVLVRVVLEVG